MHRRISTGDTMHRAAGSHMPFTAPAPAMEAYAPNTSTHTYHPPIAGPSTSPLSDGTDGSYDNTPGTSVGEAFSPGVPELPQPTKKKRRRQALNCKECKRRKIKCDRQAPCDQCVRRGEGELCDWDQLPPAEKPIGRSSYNALKEQLNKTQRAFEILQARYVEQVGRPVPPSPTPSTQPQNPVARNPLGPVQQFQAQAQSSRQASRRTVLASSTATVPANSFAVTTAPSAAAGNGAPAALIQGFETLDGFPAFPGLIASKRRSDDTEVIAASDVWTSIPEKWICDVLTEFFFDKVEWHICMFHRPSFYRIYDEFWSVPAMADRAARVKPEWIALWWAIMCLALTSMRPSEPIERKICADSSDWKSMGMRFWKLARAALDRALEDSDYLSSNNIEVVQTLVLFSYCNLALNDKGYKGSAPMTASAIRISMNLGLHRLGGEIEQAVPPEGLLFREIRRRVWWNVVFLDWNISTQMNRTYLIHPNQCDTAKPLNLDWEDMIDGRPLRPKPSDKHTNVSMLLAKILLAGSVRELCDRLNSTEGVDPLFLEQHQARQNQLVSALPPCLRTFPNSTDPIAALPVVQWEGLQFQLHLMNRRIRMHRQFMLDGYLNNTYARSTEVCISAAQRILVLFREGRKNKFPGAFAWYNLMYCWMAAVILTVDAFHSLNKDATQMVLTSSSRQDHINEAIQALEDVGDISDLAPRGAEVLRFLLRESGIGSLQLDERILEDVFNMQFDGLYGMYGPDLNLSNAPQLPLTGNPMIDPMQWTQLMVGHQPQYQL
ncbi:hypothetical protein CALCODRAFT_357919 [Calocera cornea HHB12733]|uniref:Zn(2)-C6 fungal-type domain-containing protein n=1 Tax=Calocera cornea HHB12733 TaxID=1353952 RepID=A0A165EPP8_9BASI|nr:hypothetical protein CALCODRAFT_357919 [Calocera cornea HHB12733]